MIWPRSSTAPSRRAPARRRTRRRRPRRAWYDARPKRRPDRHPDAARPPARRAAAGRSRCPNSGRPEAKFIVPSIGSMTQTYSRVGGDVVGVLFAQQPVVGKCRAQLGAQEGLGVAIERGDRVVLLLAFELERRASCGTPSSARSPAARARSTRRRLERLRGSRGRRRRCRGSARRAAATSSSTGSSLSCVERASISACAAPAPRRRGRCARRRAARARCRR